VRNSDAFGVLKLKDLHRQRHHHLPLIPIER
jgi:hypothetical protein